MSSRLSWVNLIQYDNASHKTGVNSRPHWTPEVGRDLYVILEHNLQDFDRHSSFHSDTADFTVQLAADIPARLIQCRRCQGRAAQHGPEADPASRAGAFVK